MPSSIFTRIRSSRFNENNLLIRSQLWPDVPESHVWNRKKNKGFTTIPRTLPLLMIILDSLAEKGKPVSSVYLDLWCRANDQAVVKIHGNTDQMAHSSGFSGQRAVTSWRSRLETIRKLGFIKTAAGPGGANSNALLLNPHIVLQKYREEGKIDEADWNSLTERAVTAGAKDLFTPIVEQSTAEVTTKKTTVKKRPATKTPIKKAPAR